MEDEFPDHVPMELADHNYDQSNDRNYENNGSDDDPSSSGVARLSSPFSFEEMRVDIMYDDSDDSDNEMRPIIYSFPRTISNRRYSNLPLVATNNRTAVAVGQSASEGGDPPQENENELFESYLLENNENAEHFDTDLPAEHSYLGVTERVAGIKFFEPGKLYRIQICCHHTFIYPGETYPMFMKDYLFQKLDQRNDGLFFGLVFPYDVREKSKQMHGVTCQIYEKGNESDGNVIIKSKAYQRFEVYSLTEELMLYIQGGRTYADVRILPEVVLPDPLLSYSSTSINRLQSVKSLNDKLRKYKANFSTWPKFVYDQYDIAIAMEKIELFIKKLKIDEQTMPTDLVLLSFWLARHVPLDKNDHAEIFLMNSATQRILYIAKFLNYNSYFLCKRCNHKLALYSSVFAMSKHGINTSYCNPSGFVHETVTVYSTIHNSVFMTDVPSTEFSWFPGYAWQIALCKLCRNHIGWRFSSVNPNMVPRIFFAFAGKSIYSDK